MKLFKKHWQLLIVLGISLLPLISLLKPGMYWAHDSESHLVRIASFYQSLSEGNLFPRWSASLNAGYGHPVFMFLYPLPSYVVSLFHFLGFTFAGSIKLLMAGSFVGSGILMFLWLKHHFSEEGALIGAAVWQLAPYRFVNLYVRNAFGEHVAFLFIPLTLLSLATFIARPTVRRFAYVALALAGFILSHNAVSLMFLLFIGVYAVFELMHKKKSRLLTASMLTGALILGFTLSAFFWVPAVIEGKYTLRDIVMQGDTFKDHFPSLKQLILPHWGYDNSYPGTDDDLSLQIGLIQWFMAAFGGVTILLKKRLKSSSQFLGWLALATFILSTFLLLKISLPVWHILSLLKKFQFPWRLLIMPVFASSILAALAATLIRHSNKVMIVIVALLVILNGKYWRPRGDYLPPETQVIQDYLGTTDTGESTPMWAVRFQEKRADNTLGVVHGAPITYDIIRRESELHEQTITATVPTQIAENTLYFPGWTVYVDGKKQPIIFDDISWRGVITYPVPAGTSYVKVVFEETRLRQIANAVTITGFVAILMLVIVPILLNKRQHT